MRKRGLSTVVITLIIILISLVAVGIIWVVVRNVIQTGTKEVTIGQFTLDAKIKDVNIFNSTNNVSLIIKRNPGVGEFSKMNFVFYDGKSSEVITQPVSMNELEEKWLMFHLGTINVSELKSISIFPYVKHDEKEILGNILDKYTVSGQILTIPICAPATCASLGYECGTNWANGTNCAGTLNCEPPNCTVSHGSGYNCISGICVFGGSCTPYTCAGQGYQCGTPLNGTCSGNLNCGPVSCSSYGTGYTCTGSPNYKCIDTTSPVLSNAAPTGTLVAGTIQATISLSTNENAVCRYSLTAGTSYASMTNTFTTTGATSHSRLITGLANGQSYNYYVRCNDTAGNFNTNDYQISFSVAASSGNYTYASSCSQADVQTAVNNASRGNIVVVPAGNCTWTSTLIITKGITLRGNGTDRTNILGKVKLINYEPDATAIANHETLKITGFTFDGRGATSAELGSSGLINLYDGSVSYVNAVIKNNKFKNTTGTGVWLQGTIYVVVASNQFDMIEMPIRSMGNNEYSWAAFYSTLAYGGSNNIYFEDNTIGFSSPHPGSPGWLESGQGGRIVVRYNLWNDANTTGSEYWDVHGLQNPNATGGNCQQYSTMVAEYYGNLRINIQNAYRWMCPRGSWVMQFNNVITGLGSPPNSYNEYACDDCAAFGVYPQHISNTYFWNNLANEVIKNLVKGMDACTTYTITENRDYFNYNSSCTSTSCPVGIGCGSTPPTGTCSAGTGYWVTSYSPCYSAPGTMEQIKTVTQAGRFYKCTATNTWTLYYQPYTYPHPLTLT